MRKDCEKVLEIPDSTEASTYQSTLTNEAHYYEVTGSAFAVNHPVLERSLNLEAKLFE